MVIDGCTQQGNNGYNNPIDGFISVPCCAILHLHREAPISAFGAQWSPGLRGPGRWSWDSQPKFKCQPHSFTIFHRVDSDPEWVNQCKPWFSICKPSSSVGMMTFPTEWKVLKFHGSSHHRPEMYVWYFLTYAEHLCVYVLQWMDTQWYPICKLIIVGKCIWDTLWYLIWHPMININIPNLWHLIYWWILRLKNNNSRPRHPASPCQVTVSSRTLRSLPRRGNTP